MNYPLTRPTSRITAPEKKLTRGTRSAKERSGAGGSQPPSAQEIPDGPFQIQTALLTRPARDPAYDDSIRRSDYIDRRLGGASWRLRGDRTGGWRATSGPMRGMTEGDAMARLNDEYDSSMSGGYAGRGLSGMGGGGRRGISTFQGVDGYDRTSRTAASQQTFNPPVGGAFDQALKTMGEKGLLPGQTPVAPKATPKAAAPAAPATQPFTRSSGRVIAMPLGGRRVLREPSPQASPPRTTDPAAPKPAEPAFTPTPRRWDSTTDKRPAAPAAPAAPNTADEFTTSPAGKRRRNPTFGMTAQQAGEFATATARLGEEKKAAQARVDAASAAPPRINDADSYAASLGIRLPKDRAKRAAFAGI